MTNDVSFHRVSILGGRIKYNAGNSFALAFGFPLCWRFILRGRGEEDKLAFSFPPSVAVPGVWWENDMGYSNPIFMVHRTARRIRVFAVFKGAWCTWLVLHRDFVRLQARRCKA